MKAGGGENEHVTQERRDFLITQQEALPALLHHTPHRHMHKHNKMDVAGEGVMGAGRFEYLQSKITCLASRKAPGQPIKRLGHKSQ